MSASTTLALGAQAIAHMTNRWRLRQTGMKPTSQDISRKAYTTNYWDASDAAQATPTSQGLTLVTCPLTRAQSGEASPTAKLQHADTYCN